MRLNLKIYFNSEGKDPIEIVKILNGVGFHPVVGNFDFACEFTSPAEYGVKIKELHHALKGLNIHYTLTTTQDQ